MRKNLFYSRYALFLLHSSMQSSDQKKVFKPSPSGTRKIVSNFTAVLALQNTTNYQNTLEIISTLQQEVRLYREIKPHFDLTSREFWLFK